MSGSALDQLVATELLSDPGPTFAARRQYLRQGRQALLSALAEQLPRWQPNHPDGGLFTWIRLDEPGSTELTRRAEELGLLLAPGSRFANGARLERYLRLPFTQPPEVLRTAVGRLATAWSQRRATPTRTRETSQLLPI